MTDMQPISFRDFAAETIRTRIARMLSYSDAVREGGDEEALHDMRVASRRLRAAISVCASAFTDPEYDDLERDVKMVTDALGEARDLDVSIVALEGLARRIPVEERAGVVAMTEGKRRRRGKLQRQVASALDRLARRDVAARFEQIVARCAAQSHWLSQASLLDDPIDRSAPGEGQ